MANAMRIVKGIVSLAIVGFIIAFIIGLYTALDTATSGYAQARAEASQVAQDGGDALVGGGSEASPKRDANEATESRGESVSAVSEEAGQKSLPVPASASSTDAKVATSTQTTPSPNDSSTSLPSTSSNTGSASPSAGTPSFPAPGSGPAPADASPAPAKTYHPAWDEWVEEGHMETLSTPATYGERPVYGAVCNECGEAIVGNPNQHLKETHHSGWHEGVVGYESYEITPAKTDEVWVDTSHWLHHPESWS